MMQQTKDDIKEYWDRLDDRSWFDIAVNSDWYELLGLGILLLILSLMYCWIDISDKVKRLLRIR